MGYASRSGRARTSASSPRAFAICDRCGFQYNHYHLRWQFDWAGASLINKKILVCSRCYDQPQNQLRAIIIPADPMPILNPRVEPYATDETDWRQVSGANTIDPGTGIPVPGGDTRVTTQNGVATNDRRVRQQTGAAPGSLNELPGTDPAAVTYRVVTLAANNGSGLIRLTVGSTHGMINGQNVIVGEVEGVSAANGRWVLTIVNATQIDLQGSTFSGSYTSGGYVINDPSLPYGFDEIPRTGPL